MSLDAVLDLTPKTIWFLFERAHELDARSRFLLVSDITAVAAPTQFKDGDKLRQSHVKSLLAQSGLG